MKVVNVIEGNLISDSFSIDANSAVRRTYSMELLVTNDKMLVGENGYIWMNKYIRPYICIKSARSDNVERYLKGTYTMLDESYSYNETTNTLSLSCSDLMSELNGERNGVLKSAITIDEGYNVRDVIIDILKETNVKKYILSDLDGVTMPYEIEFDATKTYYDVLNEIISLFSYYEMFFNEEGIFVIQKIPHQDSDNVVLTHEFFSPIVISEGTTTSFKEVYNKIEVWGQSLEPDFTTSTCTYNTSTKTYTATLDTIEGLDNFTTYSVQLPQTNPADSKLSIAGVTGYITDDKGNHIPANKLLATYNVFKYRKVNNDFYWLGDYQVYAEASEEHLSSPFHKSKIGEVKKVLTGDEYSKIYSNSLAQDRADYELYHACRLQETMSLNMIDIPWLDVNWLIEYQSYTTKDTNKYVIKQINGSSTSGIIDISMVLFYDQDPYS
jgi:hypothetical protein